MTDRITRRPSKTCRASRGGFTLVELLVVIGIIALLISILLPSLSKARKAANRTACMSNFKQVFFAMQMYASENRAWIFPVSENDSNGRPTNLGANVSPDHRWPVLVRAFNIKVPPDPVKYVSSLGTFDNTQYPAGLSQDQVAIAFDAKPYTPPVLLCPDDPEPVEAHSYVLNAHLGDERIRFGTVRLGSAHSSSNVIIAGEKRTLQRDYFMNSDGPGGYGYEFSRVVEPYRHGITQGSNYLFMDGHVDNRLPVAAAKQLDPWDIDTTPEPTPAGG
jgi:prepilin-type N-terminal cleavage/methylation domain-containing protein/prepilin-type processing-associated H-X9-DG protein